MIFMARRFGEVAAWFAYTLGSGSPPPSTIRVNQVEIQTSPQCTS
jgi:hypothetical protein